MTDSPSAAELRSEIETTREELAATVDEIAQRLNVKKRATESIAPHRDKALVGLAVVGAVVVLLLLRRRKKGTRS